jgi:transcriptional regulator with XRE-family HTH domain
MAKSSPNHPSKTQQKPTFRPLSIEQKNAIDRLITGATDAEVAAAVGVDRSTVWQWRHGHPLFQAELERARAEVYRVPQEKLRSCLMKAVSNLAAAVEKGELRASIELLKAVGMYGDGTMNAIREQDPEQLLQQQIDEQIAREVIPKDEHEVMTQMLVRPTTRYIERRREIEAELRARYG